MLKLILFVLVYFTCQVFGDDLVVTLPEGKIRGIPINTRLTPKFTYYGFMGVPFAAPPVGKLRFMAPQPAKNWNGILAANYSKRVCIQTDKAGSDQSEDCLYLNLYTPVKPSSGHRLPVLVFIYGGGFVDGHAPTNIRSSAFLMQEGVIVVTVNYRLGPFGFLSTEDAVIPGNMGLKDQQYALRWVHKNIHLFGGDQNKITIMGQSAGSASVTYQVLSPGSAGLFRGAIGISGSALCNWAHQKNARETAYGIANEIDHNFGTHKTTRELLTLLQKVNTATIHATSNKYKSFSPVIEVSHNGAFITEYMYEALEKGKFNRVPIYMGINSEESIGVAADLKKWKDTCKIYDKNPVLLVDADMNISDGKTKTLVGEDIKNIYVKHSTFEKDYGKAVQYFSDNAFIRPIIRFADLASKYVDVYFYQFSYHGELGKNPIYIPGIGRVGHAEDQRYFWANYDSYDKFPKSDVATVRKYVKLVANFVKYLNPTPSSDSELDHVIWPKMTSKSFPYLDLDTKLTVQHNPRGFSYHPWVELYEKYAKKPIISF